MKELFLSWGMLVISVAFNAFGVFVVKAKLNELGSIKVDTFEACLKYFLTLLQYPLVIFGVVLFFLSPFLFTIALSRMQIAIAYPAQIGLNFLFLIVLAVLFLGEKITMFKILGIGLILLGIYFLNKGQ